MNSNHLLNIEHLSHFFEVNHYTQTTWRDQFVSFCTSPLKALIPKKHFVKALHDINLIVQRGEKVGIIGENGSGKTTLCRCIADIYKPSFGSIDRNGEVRAIFDTTGGIIEELTGSENAYLLTRLLYPKLSKKETLRIVDEALDFSDLKDFINLPMKTYSRGMKARIGLSILSSKPSDLLIFDEAMEGADFHFQQRFKKRIASIIEKSGAVVIVSHDHESLQEITNRTILMKDGQILFDGPPAVANERYLNL